jgi:hypothetical protein
MAAVKRLHQGRYGMTGVNKVCRKLLTCIDDCNHTLQGHYAVHAWGPPAGLQMNETKKPLIVKIQFEAVVLPQVHSMHGARLRNGMEGRSKVRPKVTCVFSSPACCALLDVSCSVTRAFCACERFASRPYCGNTAPPGLRLQNYTMADQARTTGDILCSHCS